MGLVGHIFRSTGSESWPGHHEKWSHGADVSEKAKGAESSSARDPGCRRRAQPLHQPGREKTLQDRGVTGFTTKQPHHLWLR